jgi:hypothetical protein
VAQLGADAALQIALNRVANIHGITVDVLLQTPALCTSVSAARQAAAACCCGLSHLRIKTAAQRVFGRVLQPWGRSGGQA